MIQEFKDFINRGNVIDLAVAFVLGVAFAGVVNGFVDYLLLPLIGVIFGEFGFDFLNFTVNDVVIGFGSFLNVVVEFLLIAFGVFLVVKVINKMRKPAEEGAAPTEVELLTQIRDSLQAR